MSEKRGTKRQKRNAPAVEPIQTTAVPGVGGKQHRTMSRMNPNQKESIISYMEAHAELLSAAVSRLHPRELVDALWAELTRQLNELGHVSKTTSTWKKTWFDLRREVKAKLGPPPYANHLMALPGDMSALGQRGRIAALMTRAVLICQQHAVASLRGALKEHDTAQHDTAEELPRSPPVVELSVKCEPPDFAGFDIEELQAIQRQQQQNGHVDRDDSPSPDPKKHREDLGLVSVLQMFAASQERTAVALETLAEAARGFSEAFRQHTAIETERVDALKQIADAIRHKSM